MIAYTATPPCISCIKRDRSTMLKISKITPMEIIVIVYFFTYYSCSCSFKSARCVLIVQSMHFGTAFTDCNSIKDDGHACGAMTYHDVIRSLRHVNITPTQGAFFGSIQKRICDLRSYGFFTAKNGRFVGKKQHSSWRRREEKAT